MKKNLFLPMLTVIVCCGYGQAQKHRDTPEKSNYHVAAYVWPSCHNDPVGQQVLWPDGTGEWEVIRKGNPRFPGHYQPKQPLWGYELDNDPKVVKKWIDVALDHGVNTFIYDWYWFDEGPFLESALNDGFLKAEGNERMNFYVMWANHDVNKNYWNYHRYGGDSSPLWDGAVDWENYKIIVDRIIKQYFSKPNYLRIDGKPVFAIFSIDNMVQGLGNDEEVRRALDYFREESRKAGFEGVHFQYIPGGGGLRSEESARKEAERIETIGFDSVTMYNMGGTAEDYVVYGTNSIAIREQWDKALNIPFFPCTSIGWDDTPRFPAKMMSSTVHYNNDPESFATLLSKAKKYADDHPDQPKLITINAWNEWVEGSYLLPDMKYGFGYLEAVKNVMEGKYDR
jgi:hypothetical protein